MLVKERAGDSGTVPRPHVEPSGRGFEAGQPVEDESRISVVRSDVVGDRKNSGRCRGDVDVAAVVTALATGDFGDVK
jgi:hypothetical protein